MADLVGRAWLSSTSVASAQAALRQAQALRDVAAAALLPTLGTSASAQRGTAGGDSTGNRFQLGLEGQWVPDVFGARRGARGAGDAAAAASAANLGGVQVQIATEVALNYILLRAVQARWVIASDNLANQQETLQITDWRQQAGLVTTLEVEQARAAAAQTQALLPALKTSMDQTAHALAVLVGQPPAALQAELRPVLQAGPARLPHCSGADAVVQTHHDEPPGRCASHLAVDRLAGKSLAAATLDAFAQHRQVAGRRWPASVNAGVQAGRLRHPRTVFLDLCR